MEFLGLNWSDRVGMQGVQQESARSLEPPCEGVTVPAVTDCDFGSVAAREPREWSQWEVPLTLWKNSCNSVNSIDSSRNADSSDRSCAGLDHV